MTGELRGFFQTASNNGTGFANSLANDLLMYTSTSNQKILIGTKQNSTASLVVNSNTVSINETVNVVGDINFTGALRQNGALFQSGSSVGWSSNATLNTIFTFSNVGIGTNTPTAPLEFANSAAQRKIVLASGNNNDHQFNGFGFSNNTLRYQTESSNVGHGFFCGTSASSSVQIANITQSGIGIGHGANTGLVGLNMEKSNANISLGIAAVNGHWSTSAAPNDAVLRTIGGKFHFQNGVHNAAITIDTNNNVGINTGNPNSAYRLDVSGAARISSNLDIGLDGTPGIIRLGGPHLDSPYNHAVIANRLYGASDFSELVIFKGNDSFVGAGPDRIRLRAAELVFDTYPSGSEDFTATNPRMVINSAGNVGIGTTTPGHALDVNGTIRASQDIIAFSDSNHKCNIEPLTDSMEKIKALNGYTFNFKTNLEKRHVGVLAQEVEQVLPEAVYTAPEDGKKSVAYGNMVALLIEGVKNLEKQIQDIKDQLKDVTLVPRA